ncbi:hypothetical protein [Alteromonas sp. CYL-A6]|uniref:hypothetical protein n=1 Tax=Alteromonas nitratireducens TaxID=3390813 RepID=UPI0034B048A3
MSIRSFITLAALVVSAQGFAAAPLETCDVNDLELISHPDDSVEVLGCAGALSGTDSNADSWLQNLEVWDESGILTNVDGGTTSTEWTYVTKYLPNGTVESGEPGNSIFSIEFHDCRDNDGNSVPCSDDAVAFGVTINFSDVEALLFNQFVFVAKAAKYYSLYQVEVLEGIESLTGTMTMVSKNGMSHLSVWAANTGVPDVEVSAPATLGLLLASGLVMVRRRKQ